MGKPKLKIPTDKAIWAEVDARIATWPKTMIRVHGNPDREALFKKTKSDYQNQLKLQQEWDAKRKAGDAAYIALRQLQGKPIITYDELIKKYPEHAGILTKTSSAKDINEKYDISELMVSMSKVRTKYQKFKKITRDISAKFVAEAYRIYCEIKRSGVASETFDNLVQLIKIQQNRTIKATTHESQLVLHIIFEDAASKDISVWARSVQFAFAHDIEPVNFVEFVNEMGGMERIRKAYATVLAANRGEKKVFELNAERFAARQRIIKLPALKSIKISEYEEPRFIDDQDFGYSVIVTRYDRTNGFLHLLGRMPISKTIDSEILDFLASAEQRRGSYKFEMEKRKQLVKHHNKTLSRHKSKVAAKKSVKPVAKSPSKKAAK